MVPTKAADDRYTIDHSRGQSDQTRGGHWSTHPNKHCPPQVPKKSPKPTHTTMRMAAMGPSLPPSPTCSLATIAAFSFSPGEQMCMMFASLRGESVWRQQLASALFACPEIGFTQPVRQGSFQQAGHWKHCHGTGDVMPFGPYRVMMCGESGSRECEDSGVGGCLCAEGF